MLILMGAQEGDWDELDLAVRQFQTMTTSPPIFAQACVVAPFGLSLGGGCELTLHSDRAVAAAETYIGMVEVGSAFAGWRRTKEMALRAADAVADTPSLDQFELLRKYFELIAIGKVATSAAEEG